MLLRIEQDPYVNVIELTWIFIKREFFSSMEFLGFYDQVDRNWNLRQVFWFLVASTIMTAFLGKTGNFVVAMLFAVSIWCALTRLVHAQRL